MKLAEGLTVTISGPAGCGKTTIALAMMQWLASEGIGTELQEQTDDESTLDAMKYQPQRWAAMRGAKIQIRTRHEVKRHLSAVPEPKESA